MSRDQRPEYRGIALVEARLQIDDLRASRTGEDIEFQRAYALGYIAALFATGAITSDDDQQLERELSQALEEARSAAD